MQKSAKLPVFLMPETLLDCISSAKLPVFLMPETLLEGIPQQSSEFSDQKPHWNASIVEAPRLLMPETLLDCIQICKAPNFSDAGNPT
jgi:hypothetical protein